MWHHGYLVFMSCVQYLLKPNDKNKKIKNKKGDGGGGGGGGGVGGSFRCLSVPARFPSLPVPRPAALPALPRPARSPPGWGTRRCRCPPPPPARRPSPTPMSSRTPPRCSAPGSASGPAGFPLPLGRRFLPVPSSTVLHSSTDEPRVRFWSFAELLNGRTGISERRRWRVSVYGGRLVPHGGPAADGGRLDDSICNSVRHHPGFVSI